MSDYTALCSSVFVCAIGLSIAGAYFAGRFLGAISKNISGRRLENQPDAQRHHRRGIGIVLVMVISLATFLGVNYVDPMRFPLQFAYYWFVVVLMLVWLFALALADIRHTLLLYRGWIEPQNRVQGSLEDYVKAHLESRSVQQSQKGPE